MQAAKKIPKLDAKRPKEMRDKLHIKVEERSGPDHPKYTKLQTLKRKTNHKSRTLRTYDTKVVRTNNTLLKDHSKLESNRN